MYGIVTTKKYRKSLRRLSRLKDFKLKKLNEVIVTLQSGGSLPESCHDHQLNGYLQKFRECHVQPDVLLLYQKHNDLLILVLVNVGDHQELFGN
ncbi:MAG: type II toxin-antitoxin system YafQ family toxin [Candidatus Vogelbacteria bacterium]|nr:type II toxin-antitoxin system YafQ family toxin [Candidatus Vogelbacteria bacterium]